MITLTPHAGQQPSRLGVRIFDIQGTDKMVQFVETRMGHNARTGQVFGPSGWRVVGDPHSGFYPTPEAAARYALGTGA